MGVAPTGQSDSFDRDKAHRDKSPLLDKAHRDKSPYNKSHRDKDHRDKSPYTFPSIKSYLLWLMLVAVSYGSPRTSSVVPLFKLLYEIYRPSC